MNPSEPESFEVVTGFRSAGGDLKGAFIYTASSAVGLSTGALSLRKHENMKT